MTAKPKIMDKELLELSKKYFESVKPIIDDIPKNNRIAFMGCIPLIAIIFFSSFLLTGLVTFIIETKDSSFVEQYNNIINFFIQKTSIESPILWSVILTLLSIFAFWFAFRISSILFDKTIGKQHAIKNFSFCHLYLCFENLGLFLVNDQSSHLLSAKKHLKKYLIAGEYTSKFKSSGDELKSSLHNILFNVEKHHSWLEVTDNARNILFSYRDFTDKISERIDQEIDIDVVINILEKLLIYEFLKSNPGSLKAFTKSRGLEDKDLRNKYISEFSQMVNTLDELAPDDENNVEKQLLTKRFKGNIYSLFTGGNIVFVFLAWYVLILLLLSGLFYCGCSILEIPFDSKILVGIITIPFLVSTPITIAMITRKQK